MPPARRFEATLRSADRVSVIAEAKRASPTFGSFAIGAGSGAVGEIARGYAAAGAAALSIVTEPFEFLGSDDDLVAAARVGLPVLRKDFVVDAYGVWQGRALGADAILLIVRALSDDLLRRLIVEAGEAGVDALVEVHGSDELDRALDADATLIGVNARDLATLDVDGDAILPILRRASDAGATVVAESGIRSPADVDRVAEAGAAAVLVGTSLLWKGESAAAAAALVQAAPRRVPVPSLPHPSRAAVKTCGMRSEAGIRAAIAADADLIGFVLDQRSPRSVGAERVAELVAGLAGPEPVLVFRNPSRDEVASAMSTTGVAGIQLAGFDGPPGWLADTEAVARDRHRRHSRADISARCSRAPPTRGWRPARRTCCWRARRERTAVDRAPARRWRSRDGSAASCRSAWPAACGPPTSRRAVRAARPALVDAASGLERNGQSDPHASVRSCATRAGSPPARIGWTEHGHFGRFGGRFVPETLMPALEELEAAWSAARRDPEYRAELRRLHRDFIGRPTPALPDSAGGTGRPRRAAAHRSGSSGRTSRTPARTRSTTPSARRCLRSGWASRGSSPRPVPASTAWRPPPPARCSDWSAWSTWAPPTSSARRRTSSAWRCSAPKCARWRPATGRCATR